MIIGVSTVADISVSEGVRSTASSVVTNNLVFDGAPHWSSDGKKIVFSRMQASGQQVWVMDLENLDASGFPVATRLTNAPGTQLFATWGTICAGNGDDEDDEPEDESGAPGPSRRQ